MSNIFNLSNIFAESVSHDMIRDKFSEESYFYTAMSDLREFNHSFMESTSGLYKSISEADDSGTENKVFCQYFEDIDKKISDIINKVNETVSRFRINVENIVDANKDIIENTEVITKCKPFTFSYIEYKNINDGEFPPVNVIGIFKEEFDYIGQLLQELGPTASNQSKLKVIATIYNKLVKSDTDINKKCIESILGSCDDDGECVANFPEKLYAMFKTSEPTNVEINKSKLYTIKMSFDNYESVIESCTESASRLISQLTSISAEIKRIICGNDKNTYTVETDTDGIRNTSYKMDTYSMNQLDIFLKTKLNQVIQMCNIYYIAIAIKLDATMDYFKQCKNILTFAMANCKDDTPSDAAQDAQEDVDDGDLEVDDTLEDDDAFSDNSDDDDDDKDDDDSDDDDSDDEDDDKDDDKDDSDDLDDDKEDSNDLELEDMNLEDTSSEDSDSTTSSGDSINDLDEALNNFKEACMRIDYEEFCADTLYEYTNMLEELTTLYEADGDGQPAGSGDGNASTGGDSGNNGDVKSSVKTVVKNTSDTSNTSTKKSLWQKIKDMVNKLINLIKGSFKENFDKKYKKKIEELKANEKYINMEPISYQNEDGTPVTDFDVNMNAFNSLEIPRFDINSVRNIKDKDDFIKNTLKVDIIKDGDNTLSIAQSIERKVLTRPSSKKNFNQIDLKECYNWCINYEKVITDIEELAALLEQGAKNADAVAQQFTESTGHFSLKDTMLDYFGEATLKNPPEGDQNSGGNGGNNADLEKIQIYFNCCKDVVVAKMNIAQKIFREWTTLLDYQIRNRKGNDTEKPAEDKK